MQSNLSSFETADFLNSFLFHLIAMIIVKIVCEVIH